MSSDNVGSSVILIVEDDQSLSNLYSTKFEKEGFKVLVAHDGEDGLKQATESCPDFILLDNMLPKINGIELLKLIKEDPKIKSTPVMMLSNLAFSEERERALGLGAVDYLSKAGQSPEEIVNKVRAHMNN